MERDRAVIARVADIVAGRPLAEILGRWRELEPFLLDLGDEAHLLVAQGDLGS